MQVTIPHIDISVTEWLPDLDFRIQDGTRGQDVVILMKKVLNFFHLTTQDTDGAPASKFYLALTLKDKH